MVRKIFFNAAILAALFLFLAAGPSEGADKKGQAECFESRETGGYSRIDVKEAGKGLPNVKCSDFTGAVLWYGDPYTETVPMGKMPGYKEAGYPHRIDYLEAEAVVRPRIKQLTYYPCTMCHNGQMVKVPENVQPRLIAMHKDIVPDSSKLRHGHGRIWCLNCHNKENRDSLIDHLGNPVNFNQPQLLCGGCHGQIFHDWRHGIHGKRIGSWKKEGKKRWWVCTDCHNPHESDVRPYHSISPERAPALPKGMKNADFERKEEEERKADYEGRHR